LQLGKGPLTERTGGFSLDPSPSPPIAPVIPWGGSPAKKTERRKKKGETRETKKQAAYAGCIGGSYLKKQACRGGGRKRGKKAQKSKSKERKAKSSESIGGKKDKKNTNCGGREKGPAFRLAFIVALDLQKELGGARERGGMKAAAHRTGKGNGGAKDPLKRRRAGAPNGTFWVLT